MVQADLEVDHAGAEAVSGVEMDGVDPAFEVVHRLTAPKAWWHLTVPFKEGQTEVVLSRKLRFEWPLRTEGHRAPLDGELTLVLRKSP